MIIAESELRQIIRSELLREIGGGPFTLGGATSREEAEEWSQANVQGRSFSEFASVFTAKDIAEIVAGVVWPPAGWAVDTRDATTAIANKDPVLFAASMLGFIPFLGDLIKIPAKASAEVTQAAARAALNDNPAVKNAVQNYVDNAADALEDIQSAGSRSAQRTATASRLFRKIPFASKKIFRDDQGRQFVAIKMPGGGSKIFYRSTGTGSPDLNIAGEWFPMNGLTADGWYIKDPGKVARSGLLSDIGKDLEELSSVMPGDGLLRRTPGPGADLQLINITTDIGAAPKQAFSDMARFNQWMEEVGALVPYARTFDLPGINMTWKQATQKFPTVYRN